MTAVTHVLALIPACPVTTCPGSTASLPMVVAASLNEVAPKLAMRSLVVATVTPPIVWPTAMLVAEAMVSVVVPLTTLAAETVIS